MKRGITLLLALTLLLLCLPMGGCARPGDAPASSEEVFFTPEPPNTPAPSPEPPSETPGPPETKETVSHDWNGEGTLFPYAVGPIDLNTKDPDDRVADVCDGTQLLLQGAGYLRVFDLAEGTVFYPCAEEGCGHSSEFPNCRARSPLCPAFPANGRYYTLEEISARRESGIPGAVYPQAELCVRDAAGNRSVLGTVVAETRGNARNSLQLLYYGDWAFLFAQVEQLDPDGERVGSVGYGHYIAQIDLKNGTLVREVCLAGDTLDNDPWDSTMWVTGAYGGGVYLYHRYWDREDAAQDAADLTMDMIRERYYRYDIETGTVETRRDGYPDEYGGKIVPDAFAVHVKSGATYTFTLMRNLKNVYRPSAILGNKAVYVENGLRAVDLQSGEETLLYEGEVARICKTVDQVNLPGRSLTFETPAGEMRQVDIETGESAPFSLEDGKRVEAILGETEGALYAAARGEFHTYLHIDISGGYENCPWEEIG